MKSPNMQKFLDGFTENAYGTKHSEAIQERSCVMCKGPAKEFKDKLSEKEFTISGMCQKCQDAIFDS